MGVKGLTTYLRTFRHKLSYAVELPSKEREITVVVDGWSLIYSIYNFSGEPWVYGGEYAALGQHVKDLVLAWKAVGIRLTIVFDGLSPPLKYPTVASRLQENCVRPANLFFRTSSAARSTARSLAETRIPPPLGYSAILSALLSMEDVVDVEFAEGEADAYMVALAGKLGAYVMANDSDFAVLHCEGYKGYVPLDDLVWCATIEEEVVVDTVDVEYQVVSKRKKSKVKTRRQDARVELGTGPLPPSTQGKSTLYLVLTVYEPATLADHLSFPSSLLPLFGALVGNDYASFQFFRSSESMVDRVQRVADTLSSVLKDAQSTHAKTVRRMARGSQGGVMDVIGTTIERLFLGRDPRNLPSSGLIEETTDSVVQSTLVYAVHDSAVLFPDEDSEIGSSSRSREHRRFVKEVRSSYIQAFHEGVMHPLLMQVYARGVCFPRHFLEDPDRESCVCSIGRPIREHIWQLFAYSGGIPEELKSEPEQDMTENDDPQEEDEDEIVDVVEDFSDDEASFEEDPLAVLRGRLQRLSFSAEAPNPEEVADLASTPTTVPNSPSISTSEPPSGDIKVVTEYVRRGTRISNEHCGVSMGNMFWDKDNPIPLQLRTVSERLTVFLKILGSNTPGIQKITSEASNLERGQLLSILVLRWVIQTLHKRAQGVEGSHRTREREKEKWTRSECEAYLYAISHAENIPNLPPIEDRTVQLTAQILAASEAIQWLAQALLLVESPAKRSDNKEPLPFILGEHEDLFSGKRFHHAVSHRHNKLSSSIKDLWELAIEDLDVTLGEEREKKRKKEKKDQKSVKAQPRIPEGTGRFGALAALQIE